MSDAFRTYQTVKRYEQALARHKQWIRWVRGTLCPCLDTKKRQADPQCSVCFGRGQIYSNPGAQSIIQEITKHDNIGRITPAYTPVTGTPYVTLRDVQLSLGVQPADGSYIQLAAPYPKSYEPVIANYDYSPIISVTSEDSEVVDTTTLRVTSARFSEVGKTFEGSIDGVTRVYNATQDETYTVTNFVKEYIELSTMDNWLSGDVLEVDYTYVNPFPFMLSQVSMKMRYEQAYVLEGADAVLVTPYWAKTSPNDLFTAMASDQYGAAVIEPRFTAGNDTVANYFDLSKLLEIVDENETTYTIDTDVELYGRNEIKWLVTKPVTKYTVTFFYHPTYVAMENIPTLRSSENKSFVNRVNVRLRDKTDGRDF